ncbi:MAG TPA: alpha-amylase family glycosyl hydrolase [Anaerolineales bacterium]|nr:alpha-amylase family glycosyl hydrolase [Anaerolineales bacterium]
MKKNATPAWLEDAVFYEIYPQSFYDSNGDGIGDLLGILQKLDYIQSLGVNALWLNPCFESPFQDAGYDVSDYYKIAPRYGTNEDAKRLFDEARRRGIRVLLDLVPGHTSIEHAWFKASCLPGRNEYTDWFVWTDSGWKWEVPGMRVVSGYADRDGSYITNFFYFQPALNYGFAHPEEAWQQPVDAPGPQRVRQELRNIMKFWLDLGCSGFRVDMAGSLVKKDWRSRETAALWREMRAWFDKEYPDAVLISEWGYPTTSIGEAGFHMDFTLPFAMPGYTSLLRKDSGPDAARDPYAFPFFDRGGRGNILEFLDDYLFHYRNTVGKGLICLITGNHDINPRLNRGRTPAELELIYLFFLTMPGAPFIYYGDEIGMRTLNGLPSKEGGFNRTGSRTPMQWSQDPNAGFSSAPAEELYLPVDPAADRPTVAAEESDPASLLNRVRALIALRKQHPALCATGEFEVVYAESGRLPFVFKRSQDGESILVAVNPAERPAEVLLPAGTLSGTPQTLYGVVGALARQGEGWKLVLPGVSGGVYSI